MKISIVVPVYNTKTEYLRECLISLTNQTDFKDYEVIAVNDGSTNGCEKVIEEFASKYKGTGESEEVRVVYINQNNGGTSVARNTGLSAAKGDYIMFVDADDFISEDCLSTVYDVMIKRQSDILFFGYATNYTNREMNRVLEDPHPGIWERDTLELAVLKGNPALGPVEVGAPWGKLIKSSVIKENGLRYTEGLIKGQDTVFMLSVFEHCTSFSYLSYLGYHYRISGGSVSRRYNPAIVEIMEKTLGAYSDFVEKYSKGDEFADAVRQKYCKVMLGEYLELNYLHKDNKKPLKERENDFLSVVERDPYREVIGRTDQSKMGMIQKVYITLLKKRKTGQLFALKKTEMRLKDLIVRKYV